MGHRQSPPADTPGRAARPLLVPQPGQRGLGPPGGRPAWSLMCVLDHRLRPALGDHRHRLRLRGPGPDRPHASARSASWSRGSSRPGSGSPSARWPARPSASPRAWASPSRVTALVLTGLGYWTAAEVVLGLLAAAAFLESAFGLCLGCKAFAVLMRAGVVPEEVCERCNDIWGAPGATAERRSVRSDLGRVSRQSS